MQVLFLSGSRSRAAGGVFEVERCLAQKLHFRHDVTLQGAGYEDDKSSEDNLLWLPIKVNCFPRHRPKGFGYAPLLTKWLLETDFDLLHLHNLWMYTSRAVTAWHQKFKRPYVITPHGMLEPWALRNSGWKKKIAGLLYEKRMLRNAAVIHAFTTKDMQDIRTYGLRNPIAVIPNGIELQPKNNKRDDHREKSILFLGRLHPKKGLLELVKAWQQIPVHKRENWKLIITGWDDGGHELLVKELIQKHQLHETVDVTGPVFGSAKQSLLRSVSAFILPSFSEGLPMSVLEAWSYELPVLMTEHCNLPSGFAANAAIKISTEVNDIALGLTQLIEMESADRLQMGINGRNLVEREFTWDYVSDQMIAVYHWVLNAGPQPECIHTI